MNMVTVIFQYIGFIQGRFSIWSVYMYVMALLLMWSGSYVLVLQDLKPVEKRHMGILLPEEKEDLPLSSCSNKK